MRQNRHNFKHIKFLHFATYKISNPGKNYIYIYCCVHGNELSPKATRALARNEQGGFYKKKL